MGIISKLICEYPLPIPFDEFTGEEKKRFRKVKWDELDFFTSSFYDYDQEPDTVCVFTISEDGQFYRNNITIEIDHDEAGEVRLNETDDGIERQDFTGEIYFGAEFLEEGDYDYIVAFRSLLYKGDVKELELESWEKSDNKKRKLAADQFSDLVAKQLARKKTLWYSVTSPFRSAACFVIYLAKWVTTRTYGLLFTLENWIKK